jgi:alpha-L-fucosidase 2
MNRLTVLCFAGALALGVSADGAAPTHRLLSRTPAEDSIRGWERQSYPIGNGWFGVNVFGGRPEERLQVTENSFLTRRNLTNALDLRFRFHGEAPAADGYERSLELESGLSRVTYTSGGVRYSSPVMCYSLSAYCADQIANGTGTMQAFAKATVVYGNHAKTYFASIAN